MDSKEIENSRQVHKRIVEALIFSSDAPVTEAKISSIVEELTAKNIRELVDELNADYESQERAFFINRIAGGFQYNSHNDLAPWIRKLFKGRIRGRLSQASLEVLSIVAFKQPISRVEIDSIRGVNSGGVLKNLLERSLITISGRSDGPGKPLIYATTREFLQYVGINDLTDLPKPREIEEIMGKLNPDEEVSAQILEVLTDADGEPENGEIASKSDADGEDADSDEPDSEEK